MTLKINFFELCRVNVGGLMAFVETTVVFVARRTHRRLDRALTGLLPEIDAGGRSGAVRLNVFDKSVY